jgi:hypothetical protein
MCTHLSVQHAVVKPCEQRDCQRAKRIIQPPVPHGDGAVHGIMRGDE